MALCQRSFVDVSGKKISSMWARTALRCEHPSSAPYAWMQRRCCDVVPMSYSCVACACVLTPLCAVTDARMLIRCCSSCGVTPNFCRVLAWPSTDSCFGFTAANTLCGPPRSWRRSCDGDAGISPATTGVGSAAVSCLWSGTTRLCCFHSFS